jgi:hypothetical protein
MPDEELSDAKAEILYHYTTIDAMMKIAKSRKIWATSISYLNDSSEGDHLLSMIRNRLKDLLQKHSLDNSVLEPLSYTGTEIENRPFITSFSADGNSLPQWRSYCANGNGVAIGFRVSSLPQFIQTKTTEGERSTILFIRLKKVDYTPVSGALPIIDSEIAELVAQVDEMGPSSEGRTSPRRSGREDDFAAVAHMAACSRKHHSFINEHEYRLIADPTFMNAGDLQFRSARSTLVPYIELSIPTTDFIAEVVIGPSSNTELSLQAVHAFFKHLQLQVDVKDCRIPFRNL